MASDFQQGVSQPKQFPSESKRTATTTPSSPIRWVNGVHSKLWIVYCVGFWCQTPLNRQNFCQLKTLVMYHVPSIESLSEEHNQAKTNLIVGVAVNLSVIWGRDRRIMHIRHFTTFILALSSQDKAICISRVVLMRWFGVAVAAFITLCSCVGNCVNVVLDRELVCCDRLKRVAWYVAGQFLREDRGARCGFRVIMVWRRCGAFGFETAQCFFCWCLYQLNGSKTTYFLTFFTFTRFFNNLVFYWKHIFATQKVLFLHTPRIH